MSPAAILSFSLIAFLSAPPAFILLWILHRQTRDHAVRELAFAILGGEAIPFSPFFSILINGFIMVIISRKLVSGSPTAPVVSATPL